MSALKEFLAADVGAVVTEWIAMGAVAVGLGVAVAHGILGEGGGAAVQEMIDGLALVVGTDPGSPPSGETFESLAPASQDLGSGTGVRAGN